MADYKLDLRFKTKSRLVPITQEWQIISLNHSEMLTKINLVRFWNELLLLSHVNRGVAKSKLGSLCSNRADKICEFIEKNIVIHWKLTHTHYRHFTSNQKDINHRQQTENETASAHCKPNDRCPYYQ